MVFGDLSGLHGRVGVDCEVTVLVDSAHGLVASLDNMLQVGELGKSEFFTRVHSGELWHKLLEESLSSFPLTCLCGT